VVRLSGSDAFRVAARVVEGFRPEPARHATLARFLDPAGRPIDRGIVIAYPAPRSYTGEDLVEFCCHGGTLVPAQLLSALSAAGARLAAPGEFTRRAVLNGKLDLVQAEAVGDLVDALAPAQARAALHQVEGGLSRRISELREQLLELTALMSYQIDFPDEDDGPVTPAQLTGLLDQAEGAMDHLVRSAPAGERLRRGALVVLAGRPNSGKSSLFNALLGAERALVTPAPGTTRDTIEADADFDGWPIRLADTAGLRDAEELVERLGIEVSRRYLGAADLVLLCVEAGREPEAGERELEGAQATILVRTKADLAPAAPGREVLGIPVSVVTGEGLGVLKAAVAERLFGGTGVFPVPDLEPVLLRERHRVSLELAAAELREARPHLGAEGDAALAAHHIRRALVELDALLGAVDVEQVLDRVFSRFCVGK